MTGLAAWHAYQQVSTVQTIVFMCLFFNLVFNLNGLIPVPIVSHTSHK